MADNKSPRVLVVDDDRDILELLKYNLEKEGFKVKTLEKSHKTIQIAKDFLPDLIILDVMMPYPNGIELCRELRSMKRFQDTCIFFLTAKSEHYYRHAAFKTGADDYIEKVMGLRALTCKVNSVLKKKFVIRKSVPEIRIGNLTIRRESYSVRYSGSEIMLSKPEFELLFFFAQNRNKIISADNLIHNIWGSEIYLFDTSIEMYMDNLRRKLGVDIIRRTGGDGYRFKMQS